MDVFPKGSVADVRFSLRVVRHLCRVSQRVRDAGHLAVGRVVGERRCEGLWCTGQTRDAGHISQAVVCVARRPSQGVGRARWQVRARLANCRGGLLIGQSVCERVRRIVGTGLETAWRYRRGIENDATDVIPRISDVGLNHVVVRVGGVRKLIGGAIGLRLAGDAVIGILVGQVEDVARIPDRGHLVRRIVAILPDAKIRVGHLTQPSGEAGAS